MVFFSGFFYSLHDCEKNKIIFDHNFENTAFPYFQSFIINDIVTNKK